MINVYVLVCIISWVNPTSLFKIHMTTLFKMSTSEYTFANLIVNRYAIQISPFNLSNKG